MAGITVLTKVLVVDDDWGAPLFKVACKQLAGAGFDLVGTSTFDVDEVLSQVESVRPQVVLLDILDSRDSEVGLGLFERLGEHPRWTALNGSVQIVFCSGDPTARRHAIVGVAKRVDVSGFVPKNDLVGCKAHALEILNQACGIAQLYKSAPELADPELRKLSPLVFSPNSLAMHEVWRKIVMAGRCHEPVFISGETGTGKELVAKAIYNVCDIANGQRPKRVERLRGSGGFLAVNIAGIASEGNLQYIELFGAQKGSFSGANESRQGLFERASDLGKTAGKAGPGPGATVFLDEIGDAHPSVQIALLRVLQEGEITPMGGAGTEPVQVNFRLVSASHSLLSNEGKGLFRSDLYMRLNGIHIHLPPLRERPEDIEVLAYVFLDKLNEEYGKLGWSRKELDEDVEMAIRSSYVLSPGSRLEMPDELLRKLEGRGLMHHADPVEIVEELARRPVAITKIKEEHGEPVALQVFDFIRLRHQGNWTDEVAQRYFGSEANTEALRKWRERATKFKKSGTSRRASEGR
jgi:DNA-binding NtrC family response regulator